jgi:RNA 2',3'-cyclic 3'-phosphodiesterase
MERIRAFIAIELTPEVKTALKLVQDRLKSGGRASVKWTDPESTHLTLKFLGDVDAGMKENITSAISEASRDIHPFRLRVQGLGVFPNGRRVRVVWVGLTGDLDKLDELQIKIETNVNPLGFSTEARAFSPHLTLGRVREEAPLEERTSVGQLVANTPFEAGEILDVKSVHLVRSQLTPRGAIYTIVSSVELR